MERQIPDVWNIFSLGDQPANYWCNWSNQNPQLLLKWCDRSSACDRPRTYDKFYQKGPSNFNYLNGCGDSGCSSETEEYELTYPGRDGTSSQRVRRKRHGLKYSRTITEKDVRSIERHLSMKKTIRKKIMRDLQQAFVGNPNEFEAEPDLESLNFDPKLQTSKRDPKFLDLLRGDSDRGSRKPPAGLKNRARYKFMEDSRALEASFQRLNFHDSEDNQGILMVAADQIDPSAIDGKVLQKSDLKRRKLRSKQKNSESNHQVQLVRKRSFWQKLTGK